MSVGTINAIALIAGGITLWITYELTHAWLPDLIHQGVCTYIIGPC